MITEEKFKKYVGSRFWRHIHKETLLPHPNDAIGDRRAFLSELFKKIEKMEYSPSPPRGIIVSHKSNLVVRFIPCLTKDDYCIYFYCLKSLEDEIAENRVEGTFGGWKLGGKIRTAEESEDSMSIPDYSYNRYAWTKALSDFQKKAFQFYKKSIYKYFIEFDIANFYDSIRLDRLEILTRQACNKRKTEEVNLLFYFLSHWDKKYLHYQKQSIGLPQDEVTDCSRILANFYLQDYDGYIYKLTTANNSGYLRYADDQIIGSKNEKTAKKIMFMASKQLGKIGLNLNANKAIFLTRKEFFLYHSFDIFKLLSEKKTKSTIRAFNLFKTRGRNGTRFKREPILKKILNSNLSKIPTKIKFEILIYVLEENFLMNIDSFYMGKIYNLLNDKGKEDFIKQLNILSGKLLFNQYHLRVLNFAKKNNLDERIFNRVKENLEAIEKLN